tara:strand:+ start:12925 stop:13362 length:438 start_codon:yes stop_codon:yes gene_type:complete
MSPIVQDLNQLQADYLVLYQKLRAYHWFVKGPLFFQLHAKFEELYLQSALDVDELAERSLTLGGAPHGTMKGALEAARIQEANESSDAISMVRSVVADFESLDGWLRAASAKAAEANDNASANLLEGLADAQEKQAWMLRTFLDA